MEIFYASVAAFLTGLFVGGAAVWRQIGKRSPTIDPDARAREEALMAKLADSQEDERAAKDELKAIREIADRDARLRAAAEERVKELAPLKDELDRVRGDFSSLRANYAALESQMEAEKEKSEQRLADFNAAEKRLLDAFEALSAKALSATNEQFLKLAEVRFGTEQEKSKAELAKREKAVADLVKPISDGLEKMGMNLGEMEKARIADKSAIVEKIGELALVSEKLKSETVSLVQVLRNPSQRGRWGEMSLQRAFEDAGLIRHLDFLEQQTYSSEDGSIRPDAILSLPGGRKLIIDAKVPAESFLRAQDAASPQEKEALLRDHASKVRAHIRMLSDKNYPAKVPGSPEFTLMFMPNEGFLSAAMEFDPSLAAEAASRKIALVTPRVLMPMLWIVEYAWRQSALAESAKDIAALGTELYDRISKVAEHVSAIGVALTDAVSAYNGSVGSLQKRLLPTAKKFKEMKLLPAGAEDLTLNVVEATTQPITKPELLAPPGEKMQ